MRQSRERKTPHRTRQIHKSNRMYPMPQQTHEQDLHREPHRGTQRPSTPIIRNVPIRKLRVIADLIFFLINTKQTQQTKINLRLFRQPRKASLKAKCKSTSNKHDSTKRVVSALTGAHSRLSETTTHKSAI